MINQKWTRRMLDILEQKIADLTFKEEVWTAEDLKKLEIFQAEHYRLTELLDGATH